MGNTVSSHQREEEARLSQRPRRIGGRRRDEEEDDDNGSTVGAIIIGLYVTVVVATLAKDMYDSWRASRASEAAVAFQNEAEGNRAHPQSADAVPIPEALQDVSIRDLQERLAAKRLRQAQEKEAQHAVESAMTATTLEPEDIARCFCPITQCLMSDPVKTADGQTYERDAIAVWLLHRQTSPLTNARLRNKNLTADVEVRQLVEAIIRDLGVAEPSGA